MNNLMNNREHFRTAQQTPAENKRNERSDHISSVSILRGTAKINRSRMFMNVHGFSGHVHEMFIKLPDFTPEKQRQWTHPKN